ALCQFKEWRKGSSTLRCRGAVVPFVYPESSEAKVLENKHSIRNAHWLQAHGAVGYQRPFRRQGPGHPQRVLSPDRIQTQSNRCALRRCCRVVADVFSIDHHHITTRGSKFINQFRTANNIGGLVSELMCDLNRSEERRVGE